MERSFGRSFSDVRVHEGNAASESARAHGAEAFTQGKDITFGAGRYQPGSDAGQRLLAAGAISRQSRQMEGAGLSITAAPSARHMSDPDRGEPSHRLRARAIA